MFWWSVLSYSAQLLTTPCLAVLAGRGRGYLPAPYRAEPHLHGGDTSFARAGGLCRASCLTRKSFFGRTGRTMHPVSIYEMAAADGTECSYRISGTCPRLASIVDLILRCWHRDRGLGAPCSRKAPICDTKSRLNAFYRTAGPPPYAFWDYTKTDSNGIHRLTRVVHS